jgi:hypothetical protein
MLRDNINYNKKMEFTDIEVEENCSCEVSFEEEKKDDDEDDDDKEESTEIDAIIIPIFGISMYDALDELIEAINSITVKQKPFYHESKKVIDFVFPPYEEYLKTKYDNLLMKHGSNENHYHKNDCDYGSSYEKLIMEYHAKNPCSMENTKSSVFGNLIFPPTISHNSLYGAILTTKYDDDMPELDSDEIEDAGEMEKVD